MSMSRHLPSIFACLMSLLATGACQQDEEDSALKWGHLSKPQSSSYLLRVLPNQTIGLCGVDKDLARWAIDAWAQAIDRKGHFKYNEQCEGDLKITVKKEDMAPGQLGAAVFSFVSVNSTLTGDKLKHTMLHEMGHLWGLCDQYYQSQPSMCDPANRSAESSNKKSVMGNNGALELAEDDIIAIKAMAARKDIPGNETWRLYLAQKGQEPRQPKPDNSPTKPDVSPAKPVPPAGEKDESICKNSPDVNQSIPYVYDESCKSQGGVGCIVNLPCRYTKN